MGLTIRSKLIMSMLIVIFIIVTPIAFYSTKTIELQLTSQLEDRLFVDAAHTMKMFDHFLYERYSDGQLLASKLNPPGQSDLQRVEFNLKQFQELKKMYSAVTLFSNESKIFLQVGEKPNIEERSLEKALQGEAHFIFPFANQSLSKEIHLLVPFGSVLEKNQGVLVLTFPFTYIKSILHNVDSQKTQSISMVNLLSKDKTKIYSTSTIKEQNDPLFEQLVEEAMSLEESTLLLNEPLPHEDHFLIIAKDQGFLNYPGSGVLLAVQGSKQSIFERIENFTIQVLGIVFVGILLLISMVLFYSRTITKPIQKIKEATINVSRGRLDQSIPITTDDELGELARAFDNMRYSLKLVIEAYENEKEIFSKEKIKPNKKIKKIEEIKNNPPKNKKTRETRKQSAKQKNTKRRGKAN